MKLLDGTELGLGDRITLGGEMTGVVVAVFASGQYAKDFPASEWSYLEAGILVESIEAGIIHYVAADEDMVLIERTE